MIDLTLLPNGYLVSLALWLSFMIFGICNLSKIRMWPYLMILFTVFTWYFIEPIYSNNNLGAFHPSILNRAFDSISVFMISFFVISQLLLKDIHHRSLSLEDLHNSIWSPSGQYFIRKMTVYVLFVWLLLLFVGILRMNGDIISALFPADAQYLRGLMWSRRGIGGATSFLISTAGYTYTLLLSCFGVLFVLNRDNKVRIMLLVVIIIAWPYIFFQGARNWMLAVSCPLFLSYLLFVRHPVPLKVIVGAISFIGIDWLMKAMLVSRKVGFSNVYQQDIQDTVHLGLNMLSELCWVIDFQAKNILQPNYGANYFAELVNFIPRVVWSDKPFPGLDYAIARGFGDLSVNGVSATVSTGLIGQGVLNFGWLFGPIFAACIVGVWSLILQNVLVKKSPARIVLFTFGLALTFNLGRDITLLVLFPFVFGYIIIRYLELYIIRHAPGHRFGVQN